MSDVPSKPGTGKTGYGIDDPLPLAALIVAALIAIGLGLYVSAEAASGDPGLARISLLVGPGVGFIILLVAVSMFWGSRQGKIIEMGNVVGNIPWGGREVVLDLGCGRGLAMILASKRLETGYAVGVDVWNPRHVTGNSPLSVAANSYKQAVEDKMFLVKADIAHLPFVDGAFDVVLSAASLHRLTRRGARGPALAEAARVLREGGRVGIIDAGNGNEYAGFLKRNGMIDISVKARRFTSFPPFHVVLARKPFGG